jgi:hypothetical protein
VGDNGDAAPQRQPLNRRIQGKFSQKDNFIGNPHTAILPPLVELPAALAGVQHAVVHGEYGLYTMQAAPKHYWQIPVVEYGEIRNFAGTAKIAAQA